MKSSNKLRLVATVGLALVSMAPAYAAGKHLTILMSLPDMSKPFFVHMMEAARAEAAKLGDITLVEADGQNSSPKQTADIEAALTQGVDGIVISPNDVDAIAPGLQEAVDAKVPVVTIDRHVDKVPGLLAHVGADNVQGGEAQAKLIMKLFPNGATIINLQGEPGASAANDRNKGLHNVLDPVKDKYKIVFEDTAHWDRAKAQAMIETKLAGMATPPDVINAANDEMAFGALEALKDRNLVGKVALLGFDALPEALMQVRDGQMTATTEQMPGGQVSGAFGVLVSFLRDGKQPAQKVTLLTPITVTKDNLNQGERLNEVK
jgi:inositol transport system substrate-binding protein